MTAQPALGQPFAASDDYDARLARWDCRRDAMTDRQTTLFDYWTSAGGDRGALSVSDFDPLAVSDCIGLLHILQYDAGRDDFFYRIYGEQAAIAAKAAMHRRWVLDHPGCVGPVFHDNYREIQATRTPWLGEVFTVDANKVAPYWRRIVLPLAVEADPRGFACVTLAEPYDESPAHIDGPAG